MSNITTTVLKPMEAKRDIRTLIQSSAVRDQMAMVLPKHLTADRMARVACTTIMRVPKLALHTREPAKLPDAVLPTGVGAGWPPRTSRTPDGGEPETGMVRGKRYDPPGN